MINTLKHYPYLIRVFFLFALLGFNPIYVTAVFGLFFIFFQSLSKDFSQSVLNIFAISLAFFAFIFIREYGVYWYITPEIFGHDDIVSYINILDRSRDVDPSELTEPIWLLFKFVYAYVGFSGYNLLIFSFLSIFSTVYLLSRISININLTIFVTVATFWGFWDVFGHLYRTSLALPFLVILMTQSILYGQIRLRWILIPSFIHLSYYFFFTKFFFRKNNLASLILSLVAPVVMLFLVLKFAGFSLGERKILYAPDEIVGFGAFDFRISFIHMYMFMTAVFFSFYASARWHYWFFLSIVGVLLSLFGLELIAERVLLLFSLISSFALNSYLTFMSLRVRFIYFLLALSYFLYRANKYYQNEGYQSIVEYFSYSEPFNPLSGLMFNFIKLVLT